MKRIKRFYDVVSVSRVKSNQFGLLLDGKVVRTPLGNPLTFPSEGIGAAIATEWQLQKEFLTPNTMPMNTVLMTYLDVDSKMKREDKVSQISKFLQTDTLRFPCVKPESKLKTEQKRRWKKTEQFLASEFGIVMSKVKDGGFLIPSTIAAEIGEFNAKVFDRYDLLNLTLLETAAKYLKSCSVGVALVEGAVSPQEAFEAAYVEELCQQEKWGLVEGEHDVHNAETLLWLNGVSLLATVLKRGGSAAPS